MIATIALVAFRVCLIVTTPSAAAVRFRPVEIAGALPFGAIVLVVQGALPLLLGSLEAEHRISAAGIGLAASLEGLAIAVASCLAGLFLKPRRLRRTAWLASLVSIAATTSICWLTSQNWILLDRVVSGLAEGVLFWVSLGLISRSVTTELWGAVLNIGGTIGAFLVAYVSTTWVMPRLGVNGAFLVIAVIAALCLSMVRSMPDSYAQMPRVSGVAGMVPLRGCAALVATVIFSASTMGLFIYLLPLAQAVGLPQKVADNAVTTLLLGQIVGGILAIIAAGRIGMSFSLWMSAILFLVTWSIYLFHPTAAEFIAATAANGTITFFAMPYMYPLAVAADSSRRAALQSGPAQLLGVSIGSVAAAWAVDACGVDAVPYISAALLLLAMTIILILQLTVPISALLDPVARH
jgi:predicted MFS family arabinose efflux permease